MGKPEARAEAIVIANIAARRMNAIPGAGRPPLPANARQHSARNPGLNRHSPDCRSLEATFRPIEARRDEFD